MPLWDAHNKKPIYYDHNERVALTEVGWVDLFTGEILVAMRNAYQRKDDDFANIESEDGTNILLDDPNEIQTGFLLLE